MASYRLSPASFQRPMPRNPGTLPVALSYTPGMELTFLGTSSGTPTRARNVSGVGLRHGGAKNWYLVDCGEGTQHQILRTRLSLVRLRAIFITHVHGDHCFGLPGLLGSAALAGRRDPLTIVLAICSA